MAILIYFQGKLRGRLTTSALRIALLRVAYARAGFQKDPDPASKSFHRER